MRNQGDSDHHASYDIDEMTNDVMRYMDTNKITMATIGGHGFGAKLATATANANLDRFTGVINLEGGPVCHKYHEAWYELKDNIDFAANMKL
jgi:pimeloyl-ACP methyl ester carboxylesterase